jgi:hypothetical protein
MTPKLFECDEHKQLLIFSSNKYEEQSTPISSDPHYDGHWGCDDYETEYVTECPICKSTCSETDVEDVDDSIEIYKEHSNG